MTTAKASQPRCRRRPAPCDSRADWNEARSRQWLSCLSRTLRLRTAERGGNVPANDDKKRVRKSIQGEANLQSITAFLEWLQASSLAVFIHKKAWAFTTVEVVHVFAIALVIGTIAIVDLRLLGFASTKRPVAELSRQVLPFTWAAFVLAVIAGSLLFISRATEYFGNSVFWIKMALIVVAGINMVVFEFITVRGVQGMEPQSDTAAAGEARGRDIDRLLGPGPGIRSLDRLHPADGVMRRIGLRGPAPPLRPEGAELVGVRWLRGGGAPLSPHPALQRVTSSAERPGPETSVPRGPRMTTGAAARPVAGVAGIGQMIIGHDELGFILVLMATSSSNSGSLTMVSTSSTIGYRRHAATGPTGDRTLHSCFSSYPAKAQFLLRPAKASLT